MENTPKLDPRKNCSKCGNELQTKDMVANYIVKPGIHLCMKIIATSEFEPDFSICTPCLIKVIEAPIQ